jgi:hypothetical protein
MPEPEPRTGPRHEPERIYERAADPAEGANRALEPKDPRNRLSSTDDPEGISEPEGADPHHALNTPVGDADPEADSDPYREPTEDDEADRAGGTTGSGQGAEGRQ